jgi:hypothetical protein
MDKITKFYNKKTTNFDSSIWVKTIRYTYKNLDEFAYEMDRVSTEGYCETKVSSMS